MNGVSPPFIQMETRRRPYLSELIGASGIITDNRTLCSIESPSGQEESTEISRAISI